MKKILFDSSIHFGQFCINSEEIRIACKNSQVLISTKPNKENIGIVTFNENSWVDHIVWSLERETQDIFYKFMDLFHSIKNLQRIPLTNKDVQLAMELSEKFELDISNALTWAVAVSQEASEVHTYYKSLLNPVVVDYVKSQFNIRITKPSFGKELKFLEDNLEGYYHNSLITFRKNNVNLLEKLHN